MSYSDDKFFRDYILTVEDSQGNMLEIGYPYTCNFNCVQNIFVSANTSNFKIYNLSKELRENLYKDAYNTLDFRRVEFRLAYRNFGGYANKRKENLKYNIYEEKLNKQDYCLVFVGNIKECKSYKEDKVNFITEFDCFDGDFSLQNGYSSFSMQEGSSFTDIFKNTLQDLTTLSGMQISETIANNKIQKAQGFMGPTTELLTSLTSNNFYVNNNIGIILPINEYFDDEYNNNLFLIDSKTGLLKIPQRQQTSLILTTLLEPKLQIGQIVELKSNYNTFMNGIRKIVGLEHTGIISPVINGSAETKIYLYYGTEILKIVKGVKINAI